MNVADALTEFLRTYDKPFTAKEIISLLKKYGEKTSKDEVHEFLYGDERVFSLEGNYYMTRAAAFTGCFFSFVPTQQELDQKLFVPGDRCIPFTDFETYSFDLKFKYKGEFLPKKTMAVDCNLARDLFTFFGDEYASQYIASDPVNESEEITNNNFELPPKLKLTGFSLAPVFKDCELKKGDRIICRLADWDRGIIEIFPVPVHMENPFLISSNNEDLEKWNKNLENALLDTFDKMGPCSSMDQQLSYAFFEHRSELCSPFCSSIREFLEKSKKVDLELFGVETRLWKKGQTVPAIGGWNKDFLKDGICGCIPNLRAPECIVDCLIKDQLYEKKFDPDAILKYLLPEGESFTKDETDFFTLQIKHRNDILREHYNWFADFPVAELRHKALGLYSKLVELIADIDRAGEKVEQFPQQELVTLSQLFTHLSRMLEQFTFGRDCAEEEKTALKLSLEGMEYNFEDIRPELKNAVERAQAGNFKVLYC